MNMTLLKIAITIVLLSTSFQAQQDSIKAKVNDQTEPNITINEKVDSLEAIVSKHQIKEGFFYSQLSSQTGVFSLIVLGLLSLATLINWGIITKKAKDNKKYIDEKLAGIQSDFATFEKIIGDRFSTVEENLDNTKMDLLDSTVELFFSQYLINKETDFRIVMLTQALKFDYFLVEIYKEKNITEGKRYIRHTRGLQIFLNYLSESMDGLDGLKEFDGYYGSLSLIQTAGEWEHVYELAKSDNEEVSEKAKEVLAKYHRKVTEEIKSLEEDR